MSLYHERLLGSFRKLQQVTTVSKYLALALFITLPFLGGYVGYHIASTSVVGIHPIAVEENLHEVQDTPSSIDDLRSQFARDVSSRLAIDILYTLAEDGIQYVKAYVPNSSGCCSIYKYLESTGAFYDTGIDIDITVGTKESPTGRFIPVVEEGGRIDIYDLKVQAIAEQIIVGESETLIAQTCGYAPNYFDLKWLDDTTLQYGVFQRPEQFEGCPDMVLLAYRTITLPE